MRPAPFQTVFAAPSRAGRQDRLRTADHRGAGVMAQPGAWG